MHRRKHWGWGYEDDGWSTAQLRVAASGLQEHLRIAGDGEVREPVPLDEVDLPPPRVAPPDALSAICASDTYARASHAWGKSYSDVVRGFNGEFDFPPDVVAHPRGERDVEAVLEWAAGANLAVVPYGGGTSVSGGVQCEVPARFDGAVSLDLSAMDRVLRIDDVSRAALIQCGANGPGLEQQLRALDLTMRFYPQSFELSTLGGWIATRAGGHFATVETHIDDLVESVRAITPTGEWQSRRLPGSGAGVSPDRMLLGSEGILGVLTEAWVRVRPRPQANSLAAVRFATFAAGIDALRAIAQSGLRPSNCRLIDAEEARMTGASDGSAALLVLGFEGASEATMPVGELLDKALHLCAEAGGEWDDTAVRRPRFAGDPAGSGDAVGAWRAAFFRAPYLRDAFVAMGILGETFETAVTWSASPGCTAPSPPRPARRWGRRGGSRAASRTSIPTARRRTSRCWPPRGAARRSRNGRRSRPPSATRCWRRAARSPTITRSAATTGRGMTVSARTRSRRRCARRSSPSIPGGCSTPAC